MSLCFGLWVSVCGFLGLVFLGLVFLDLVFLELVFLGLVFLYLVFLDLVCECRDWNQALGRPRPLPLE